jgi:hypothetical protein
MTWQSRGRRRLRPKTRTKVPTAPRSMGASEKVGQNPDAQEQHGQAGQVDKRTADGDLTETGSDLAAMMMADGGRFASKR